MTNKDSPQGPFIPALTLSSFLLMQSFVCVTFTYAEQAARPVGRQPSSMPAVSRNTDARNVAIFDNALLDKLFAKDRAAAKRDDIKLDEAAVNQSGDKKPVPPALRSALLLPNDSFAAKITSRTPSNLAAALRFAEQGRRQIRARQYHKAVGYFERAVSLGLRSYLPYIYYYLAQTHHHLANYQYAFDFLDVAEPWLAEYTDWMTSIAALRQDNINAMGYAQTFSGSKTR